MHPDSAAAYEMAARGPVRPKDSTAAVFYGLKLLELRKPFFRSFLLKPYSDAKRSSSSPSVWK